MVCLRLMAAMFAMYGLAMNVLLGGGGTSLFEVGHDLVSTRFGAFFFGDVPSPTVGSFLLVAKGNWQYHALEMWVGFASTNGVGRTCYCYRVLFLSWDGCYC